MAMAQRANADGGPMLEMNATPLIDVMLVLLIMFIITVPVLTHSVQLLTPGDARAKPAPVLDVNIEYGGVVTLDGTPMTHQQLEHYFQRVSRQSPQPVVRVHMNNRARYEVFAQVLAIAQRNGMRGISLVPQE